MATTKKKTALSRHMAKIGQKGAEAVKKKYGKKHYKNLADLRWGNNQAKKLK